MTDKLVVRKFLNRPGHHSLAAVFLSMREDLAGSLEGELTISDCRKTVTIEMDGYCSDDWDDNDGDLDNTIHKLRVLESTVRKARVFAEGVRKNRK